MTKQRIDSEDIEQAIIEAFKKYFKEKEQWD